MIYDEHLKNANRSKLRRNRPADLLFCARFSASRPLLKSPIFREADRVAQRSTATLAVGPAGTLPAPLVRFFPPSRVYPPFSYFNFPKPPGCKNTTPLFSKKFRLPYVLFCLPLPPS